jgi:carboxylesterase type B
MIFLDEENIYLLIPCSGGRNDDLFVGGIGESVFFPTQPKVSELEWQFEQFVSDALCSGSVDELECLRSQNTTTLQAANKPRPYPGQTGNPAWYWTPSVDGDFIQDYPYKLFEQGKFVKVPVMFGGLSILILLRCCANPFKDDTDEGTAFAPNAGSQAEVATFMKNNYPRLTANDTDAINSQYPLMAPLPGHLAYFPSVAAAYGEATLTCAGNFISNSYARYVSPQQVWNYRYNVHSTYNDEAGMGVPHTIETVAVFGVGNVGESATTDLQTGISTYNNNIVPVVMNYWISFVRALDPNTYKFATAPNWSSFGTGQDGGARLRFETNATEMELIPQDQVARCEFWKGLAETMEQ